jgi:hypothetical protein
MSDASLAAFLRKTFSDRSQQLLSGSLKAPDGAALQRVISKLDEEEKACKCADRGAVAYTGSSAGCCCMFLGRKHAAMQHTYVRNSLPCVGDVVCCKLAPSSVLQGLFVYHPRGLVHSSGGKAGAMYFARRTGNNVIAARSVDIDVES